MGITGPSKLAPLLNSVHCHALEALRLNAASHMAHVRRILYLPTPSPRWSDLVIVSIRQQLRFLGLYFKLVVLMRWRKLCTPRNLTMLIRMIGSHLLFFSYLALLPRSSLRDDTLVYVLPNRPIPQLFSTLRSLILQVIHGISLIFVSCAKHKIE